MLNNGKILPPPWIAYPEFERYSIGWRMGLGESYIVEWGAWYGNLSLENKAEYQKLFPEPLTWKGYWSNEHNSLYYEKDDFFIELLREGGEPKYSLEQIRKDYSAGKKQKYGLFCSKSCPVKTLSR